MHIFSKKGLTYVIIFTHSNVLCYLERCFSPVEVIISIEATVIGDAWRCLYAPAPVFLDWRVEGDISYAVPLKLTTGGNVTFMAGFIPYRSMPMNA